MLLMMVPKRHKMCQAETGAWDTPHCDASSPYPRGLPRSGVTMRPYCTGVKLPMVSSDGTGIPFKLAGW